MISDNTACYYASWLTEVEMSRSWAWTLWEAVVPLPQQFEGRLEILCKAVDAACNTQPESAAPIWNLRGAELPDVDL